jgi:hypothetical protein
MNDIKDIIHNNDDEDEDIDKKKKSSYDTDTDSESESNSYSESEHEKSEMRSSFENLDEKNNITQNKIYKYENNSDNFFKELLSKQLKILPTNKKLQYNDLKRISKYIFSSIFDENNCSIWNGYITNAKIKSKVTYINFYFRKNKVALHRLLYINFVGELDNNEYLKFNCNNKGKCCNIYHMNKFKYNKSINVDKDISAPKIINNKNNILNVKKNSNILLVVFD